MSFRRSARGAAIISVLLTVALATLIVSGLFFREQVTVRSVENRIALTQTRWVERAAIDWSKVILAADARTAAKMDHLGEPWAVPVEETRLDETVTAGARIDDDSRAATLSGAITDAQGRFNLNNLLIQPEGEEIGPSTTDAEIFRRLLDLLGLSTSLADALVARLLAAAPGKASAESVSLAARDEPQEAALPLIRVGDLITVRGFDAETVADIEPFVTFLPQNSQPRPTVNVNTASAEVLAAVLDVGIGQARQLADKRDRTPYQELAVFKNDANALNENISEDIFSRLSLNSKYFLVRGLIRFGRVESLSETLLHRTDNRRVDVIWQRRL